MKGLFKHFWQAACLLLWMTAGCSRATPPPTPTAASLPPAPVASPTAIAAPTEPPATATPSPTPSATPTATPTRTPVGQPLFGIESQDYGDPRLIRQAGAAWSRRNALLWSSIEAQEGQLNWQAAANLEAELVSASELGLQVILIVRGAPDWAQQVAGHSCGPIKLDRLEAFAAFVAAAVARYSQPPYNVKYWELGNEPDIEPALVEPNAVFGCWGQAGDPFYGGGYYAEMLKAVYPQVKAQDPAAQVLFGGLLLNCDPVNPPEKDPGSGVLRDCTPSRFLEGALQSGAGPFFDGVSFHAYDYYVAPNHFGNGNWHSNWQTTGPALIAKVRYLKALLEQYGYPEKYLLNTESALLCGRSGDEAICQTPAYQQAKAGYLVKAFTAAQAEGLRVNNWYSLRGWRGSELIDADYKPLPAYQALTFNANRLSGVAFQRAITDYPNVQGYAFQRGASQLWVVWALTDQPQTLALPEAPAEVYDFLGEPLEPAQELTITTLPVYIVWHP